MMRPTVVSVSGCLRKQIQAIRRWLLSVDKTTQWWLLESGLQA